MTREHKHRRDDELVIMLAGQPGPLAATPPLAARFPAVIDFPGYTPAQLAGGLAALAGEAGFTPPLTLRPRRPPFQPGPRPAGPAAMPGSPSSC